MKYLRKSTLSIGVAATIFMCLGLLQSADAKVIKTMLTALPAEFRGNCPGVISFTGAITVDSPGAVKYVFTRSDGAIDTITKKLIFKKAGTQKVSATWTLGGQVLPFYEGWEAIKVTSPNNVISNKATFQLKCNPPLNSAISAHGNTDWHLNTANEFLFGVDMNGNVTAPSHAPDGWSKQHMHVGLTKTSKYYYDKNITAAGEDTNAASGIDRAMLFYYAGHGNPTGWSALGEFASQPNMRLANVISNGILRYYWQCSCEVFAHGPQSTGSCAGATMDYGCPQNFDGSHDSVSMRNVFERWGPVLTPDLRMACGGSTSMYCWNGNVNNVWNDFNNNGMSVAESFINGFSGSGVVPLCITMGGSNIASTPLYTDTAFTNQPNTSGSGYYHIMYLGGGAQTAQIPSSIPKKLPKVMVTAAELPMRLKNIVPSSTIPHAKFAGEKAIVHINPASGSIHMVSEKRVHDVEAAIEEKEYISRADALVKEMQWDSIDLTRPVMTRLLTASMPVGGSAKDIKQGQKAVLVKYSRQIEVKGVKVNVLGAGGKVNILMTTGGNILNANRVWRKVKGLTAEVPLKSFEEAQAEAIRKLSDPGAYRLDEWNWGYKEPAGNVEVAELPIVFQFGFVAKNHDDLMKYPPVFLEIPAEKE